MARSPNTSVIIPENELDSKKKSKLLRPLFLFLAVSSVIFLFQVSEILSFTTFRFSAGSCIGIGDGLSTNVSISSLQ